jgi:hypothetical protein
LAVLSRDDAEQAGTGRRDWTAVLSSPWMLPAILLAAFIIYAPTLADWFTGDDFWFLRAAQQHSIESSIHRAFDYRLTGGAPEFDRYRPLYPIAWRLEYAMFGLHAIYYHAVVIALHLACVVVAWFIARRLFSDGWAANLATLVFALHPAYVDAIAWVSGGNRVFAALPYLLSLLCYMRFQTEGQSRAAAYAGSLALFVVAVLFHSSSLTLAAVLPAYVFLVAGEPRGALRPRSWLPFVPFFVVVAIMGGIQYWVRGHLGVDTAFKFGWHQYATYGSYFGIATVPFDAANHGSAISHVIGVSQAAGSLAIIVATVILLTRSPFLRTGAFAAVWLYVALLPDSTLILGTFGRAMYVPGAAFALVLVATILWARDLLPPGTRDLAVRAAPYLVLAVILPVMIAAYARERGISHDGSRNERFAIALRQEARTVPAGGTLYVLNVPSNLLLFGDASRLQSLGGLYFGDRPTLRAVVPLYLTQVEASLGPNDRIFRYQP